MGSEALLDKYALESCHFPTSKKRDLKRHHFEVLDVFDPECTSADPSGLSGLSTDLVCAAWATLLKTYVRKDSVSFAVLSDLTNCDAFNSDVGVEDLYEISSATIGEALVLQFQVHEDCLRRDNCPAYHRMLTLEAVQEAQINTAIRLSTPYSFVEGEQLNGYSYDENDFKPGNLGHQFVLILNYRAAISSNHLSVSYLCPTIPRKYACAIVHTFRKIVSNILLCHDYQLAGPDDISDEDKRQMISWNPKTPYGQMSCMHYLVEAVARAIPNAEAVCAWDGSLTYSQLDSLSTVAAQVLVDAGVGPGVYVPFAYEKSLWTVVATFAILKAGGAFVPLNPSHPIARLEEILINLDAKVLVTSEVFASTFQGIVKDVVVISSRTILLHPKSWREELCFPVVRPEDPIFVLFTSGSTGHPKGMIHEHGSICTHAITHGEAMGYQGARVLQFAAHTFDVAIIDIFTTLIFGGCICIPSEEDRRSNITSAISTLRANYAILTPSFASLIDPSEVPTLQTLAVGGEALTQDRVDRWANDVSLIQIYGPAEVGICMMMHMDSNNTLPETIGFPLRNSSCWLVDPADANLLVPIGAVGELVVAGPSLARGYLNNDLKTQSCFVNNLAWAEQLGLKGVRFYKTGDLLRYNVDALDGSFDFVGRKDNQIKLRGQRMELGEVEHCIAAIPGVAVSMVSRPDQGCFSGELVAIVQMRSSESVQVREKPLCLASDQSLSIEAVSKHISKYLPSYMIPTACIVVSSLPFVPSLKIDRRMVDAWLMKMKSRPSKVAADLLAELKLSPLNPSENTANVISVKVAELLRYKDLAQQLDLEGYDFCLQKAGIDSIQIISLAMYLRRTYAVKIPAEILLSSKTMTRDLASIIDRHNLSIMPLKQLATVDVIQESRRLTEDMFRAIEVQYLKSKQNGHVPIENVIVKNLLLTGASGYLGSAILQYLMARPDIVVFALVRCPTATEGLNRIRYTALRNCWWQEAYTSRIQVWPGDLTTPGFGLTDKQMQQLQGTAREDLCIHAIIHNGARVHYSSDYDTLKGPNVHPTVELLKVTANSPNLSTFVYVSGGRKPCVGEEGGESTVATELREANGYAQSKFVSEAIVKNCVGYPPYHAKHLYTVKPGYIIGSSEVGIANQSDFIWRLIAGCVEVKAYNKDEAAHWLFIAEVDRVAQRVLSGVFDQFYKCGKVESVLDGLLFSDLWALLQEDFGYDFEALGHDEWLERLQSAIASKQESHLLFPLALALDKDSGTIGSGKLPAIRNSAIKNVIRRNVRYLIDVGFLPPAAKYITQTPDLIEKEEEKLVASKDGHGPTTLRLDHWTAPRSNDKVVE